MNTFPIRETTHTQVVDRTFCGTMVSRRQICHLGWRGRLADMHQGGAVPDRVAYLTFQTPLRYIPRPNNGVLDKAPWNATGGAIEQGDLLTFAKYSALTMRVHGGIIGASLHTFLLLSVAVMRPLVSVRERGKDSRRLSLS